MTDRYTLSVADLELSYGNVKALDRVSLDVRPGEFIALLGPSGCGKTTLLRAIAGFIRPQSGRITLNGRDVADQPPRLRNIGVVFQNYALFPHMTVAQNVQFGLECRAVGRDEIARRTSAALARVGLAAFAGRRPKQLSGGQQQRVALARALVIEPDLLLLDEPLGALDKQLRLHMQSELKALQRSLGVTAIFVTHDQEEALAMADRVIVIRNGRIEQEAAPGILFTQPCNGWVADFINAGNLISGATSQDAEGTWSVEAAPGTTFRAPANAAIEMNQATLLVPFHKVHLEKAESGSPFTVTTAIPMGLAVELQLSSSDRVLRAQLPIACMGDFPVGTQVRPSAKPDDCIWLPVNSDIDASARPVAAGSSR